MSSKDGEREFKAGDFLQEVKELYKSDKIGEQKRMDRIRKGNQRGNSKSLGDEDWIVVGVCDGIQVRKETLARTHTSTIIYFPTCTV